MPRHPSVYGNLLKERIAKGEVDCWLVNTGWTGGKYGVGKRMPIKETRALLNAALDGSLKNAKFRKDPNFGFEVPVEVPGVDTSILDPRGPGPTRRSMTRWRRSSSTCSSRISPQFADQSTRACGKPRPGPAQQSNASAAAKPRPLGPVAIGPAKDPINDRFPPRCSPPTPTWPMLAKVLLARSLPRDEWTHEAHLAATTYLVLKHPEIDLDRELPGSSVATTRASAA